jgi:hypothetical protein
MTPVNLIEESTKDGRLCYAHISSEAEELNKNTNTSYLGFSKTVNTCIEYSGTIASFGRNMTRCYIPIPDIEKFNCVRLHPITVTDNCSFLPRIATTLVKLIKLDNDRRLYPN